MRRIKRSLIAFLCISTLLVFSSSFVTAETDSIQLYKDKLEEINTELGTNYRIPDADEVTVTGKTYAELEAFYQAMDLKEFENYIHELHAENDQTRVIDIVQPMGPTSEITPSASDSIQYYYYSSSNNNYLALYTKVIISGGVTYYNSVTGYGYNSPARGYPYYVPFNMSYSVSSDSRKLTCSYSCAKYISQYIIDNINYTLRVTFTAGGGSLYA